MPIRGLWFFFDIRGRFQEAEGLFRQALQALEQNTDLKERAGEDYDVLVARLFSQQGWFCMRLGRNDQARALLERSIQPLRCSNAKEALLDALHNLGVFYRNAGEYRRSQELFQEALNTVTQIGDEWNIARAKGNLGLGSQALGELQEAYDKTVSAIRSYRTLGDKRMNAVELQYLGGLSCELGMYESAKKNLQESLEISRAIDDPWGYGMALTQLGIVLQMQGALQDAFRLCRESLALFRELGECGSILRSLNQLGQATLALGDYYESQEAFREALITAMEVHNLPEVLETLTGIASWLIARGQIEDAEELVELVLDNSASNREVLDRVGKIQTVLEAKLSQEQLERIQAETRSLESVVDESLERHLNIGIRGA
jgi:tetratricopeptide (TPR) repeat protein